MTDDKIEEIANRRTKPYPKTAPLIKSFAAMGFFSRTYASAMYEAEKQQRWERKIFGRWYYDDETPFNYSAWDKSQTEQLAKIVYQFIKQVPCQPNFNSMLLAYPEHYDVLSEYWRRMLLETAVSPYGHYTCNIMGLQNFNGNFIWDLDND